MERWQRALWLAVGLTAGLAGCDDQPARCEETSRAIPWDDAVDGGMSGQAWMDAYAGTFSGELNWATLTEDVEGTVPEAPTAFTLIVEADGETFDHIDAERVGGDGSERLACTSTLRLPARARLVTDDGALEVDLTGRLYAWPGEGDRVFGSIEFDPALNAGSARFLPVDPERYDSRIPAHLRFDLGADGVTGSVSLEAVRDSDESGARSSTLPEFYAEVASFTGTRSME